MVLYAFFVGYILTQIPGGYLAETYSATRLLGLTTVVVSLLSCFTAVAARTHIYALLAFRFVEGLAEVSWGPSRCGSRVNPEYCKPWSCANSAQVDP